MKQDNLNHQLRDIADKVTSGLRKLRPYSIVLFLAFVVFIYGFLLLRTHNLSDEQPSSDAVTSQVKAARLPHIDQSVVNQLKSLRDNSVSVKALFDRGRNNPFQ